ncbi:MAG: peptidase S8 and S53 subtilisin kexin sedolisin [Chitinophagaceae bacterium]|nr:MAG: peptidase S8 and S53 subtilisin kexin sedolisin [Chitinophagaceae bacterium]
MASTNNQPDNLFGKQDNRPRFTGKRILTMSSDAKRSSIQKLTRGASLKMASINDFKSDMTRYNEAFQQADGIYFDNFKVAVVNEGNEDQLSFMMAASAGTSDQVRSEPERYVYALPATTEKKKVKVAAIPDSDEFSWGCQAIKLPASKCTGAGVNIAVLDTGLNLTHPDFSRLKIQHKSFIKRQGVEDANGHGTHCCGISVGAIQKKTGWRYGVAKDANLFVGKVLSNQGVGYDSGILAGIEWALQNKCKVISMSLGSGVEEGETFSPAYERVARTALANGCIIIAAAGNESEREFGLVKPVGHPANCPSVMAVAALDNDLRVADFSCGGLNLNGGQVDIAAPGVDIYSSWKGRKHRTISGTSMATPFVAGIAALLWEKYPKATPADIWMKLVQLARRLNLPATDVGIGLAQCPS